MHGLKINVESFCYVNFLSKVIRDHSRSRQ